MRSFYCFEKLLRFFFPLNNIGFFCPQHFLSYCITEPINCFSITKSFPCPRSSLLSTYIFLQCSGYTDVSFFLKDCSEFREELISRIRFLYWECLFPTVGKSVSNDTSGSVAHLQNKLSHMTLFLHLIQIFKDQFNSRQSNF